MGRLFTLMGFAGMLTIQVIVGIVILLLLPNVPPYSKFEKSYRVTPSLPLEGSLALNEKLNDAELWHHGDFKGPEAFAEYNGELYASLHSGEIVKLSGNDHITPIVKFGKPCQYHFEERICGRPLGIKFDKSGQLYAADAYYGIWKVDVKTGEKVQLVSPDVEIEGSRPKLFNSIAIASDGSIYWTDSSTNFLLEDGLFDMLSDGSGRVLRYNPNTKRNAVLIDNLHFANGLALSKNEDFLIISETGQSKIHRYYLKGPKAGTHDVFLDGLPGLPDNLTPDGHGGFFVPLVAARDADHPSPMQIFLPFPRIRKLLARVLGLVELSFSLYDQVYPNHFAKLGVHYVGNFASTAIFTNGTRVSVLHVDESGKILDSLHGTNGRITGICEVAVYKDHLLLGSPFNEYVGRLPLSAVGYDHLKQTVVKKQTPPVAEVPKKTQPTTTEKPKATTQKPVAKPQPTQAPKPQPTQAPKPQPTQAPKPQPTQAPKPQPTQAPKPATTQAPKQETAPPKQAVKPQTPPTQAPKVKTPPPTQAPKPQTPPPTQAPKQQTPPPKQAPKPQSPPPTQVPKPQTPPPTQASKPQTPPPTQAPKPQTPPPTQAPKPQTPPPTQAPKPQTPPPTQAPKPQTPPPKQAPKPQTPQAPKPATTQPPKQESKPQPAKESQRTTPPSQTPPTKPVPTNSNEPKPKA